MSVLATIAVLASVTDRLLHLHGFAALAVVFALPALESSAFVGFVFPGEIAVLLGGVLAYQHRVSLAAVMVAATLGAAIGDTIGFEVGKRWGRGLLDGTVGRFVKREHLARAEQYLAARGGKAVFVGRFTAALRVVLPGMAGMAGMPYPTFVAWNVAGAALWAPGFVLLGYAAGNGWRRVESVAKQASILLLVAAVVVGTIVVAARWIAHHPERTRAAAARVAHATGLDRVAARFQRQLAFLGRRFDPRARLGLGLTAGVVAVGLLGWLFGTVTEDVVAGNDAVRIDRPLLEAVAHHREPWLTTTARAVDLLGGLPFLAVVCAGVGVFVWAKAGRRPLVTLVLALAGSVVLSRAVGALVGRTPPPASLRIAGLQGAGFPSDRATQATAAWGALAALVVTTSHPWRTKVAAVAAAAIVVLAVVAARLYEAVSWPTDVAGGMALGLLWLTVVGELNRR